MMTTNGKIDDEALLDLVREVLLESGAEPGFVLTMDSELGDEGWDSMGLVFLLTQLDRRFDGKVATYPGVTGVQSMRGIVVMLRELGVM